MNAITGGMDGNTPRVPESFISAERGELTTVLEAIEDQTGKTVHGILNLLNIEDHYVDKVQGSINRAVYRVADVASVATDLDILLTGNLIDQLAQLRGVDCVKVHLSVFEAMVETAEKHQLPEGVSPRHVTWAWEVGRFAGRTLQRNVDAHIAPLSIPRNLGMQSFFEKIVINLFGENNRGSLPKNEEVSQEAIEDYRHNGLPERLASAMGNVFAEYFYGVSPMFLAAFEDKLREKVLHPYSLAQDFGNEFRPDMSYKELSATHPLSHKELQFYLEYISRASDTIYIHDC